MTPLYIRTRRNASALAFLILALLSCETRMPTQPGGSIDDVVRPSIKFTLTGGKDGVVDVGAAASVSVQATDDQGVTKMVTTVNNGALVLGTDTVLFATPTLTTTRVVPLQLVGLANGDKVTIRTTATDIGENKKVDSLVISLADTIAPNVALVSASSGKTLKGGDTLEVKLTASDSSGVKYVGYRLYFVRPTDSLLIRSDSTLVPAGSSPRTFPTTFKFVLPDTLPVGTYAVGGFARDASGIVSPLSTGYNFTLVDLQKPRLTFNRPIVGGKLNIGDSLLVGVRLTDNIGLKSVSFLGVSARGNPALGTADTVLRYGLITAPGPANGFRAGLRDTTIQRYLKPLTPIDTLTDSLVVIAIVTDQAANIDTSRITIRMVSGPNVIFLSPVPGDSANRGGGLTVTLQATHAIGVARVGFRIQSDPTWPVPIDQVFNFPQPAGTKLATVTATIQIPASAIPKTLITITPTSTDVNGEDGSSAPATIAVRAGAPPAPRVMQNVAARLETTDSITITALGSGITYVGFEATDALGVRIKRDSVAVPAPAPSTAVVAIALNLASTVQGKRIFITSFAYDQGGRIGYSLRTGVTTPQPLASGAFADTALVVFGRTYPLPTNRNGTIADLQVDPVRGNIFLSNINFGRLEVFTSGANTFDPTGIVVGSQPWGMAFSRTAPLKDTMYVANSGGTNLSRVFIGGAPSTMREDLVNRLVTRASYLFKVTETIDAATGKIRVTTTPPILFSDRPQNVEQSMSGRLYFSTKPTIQAPQGTIRYLNPAAPAPDERFILDFAFLGSDPNSWVIANLDAILVTPAPATSTASDVLTLCDHPSGSTAATTCASSSGGILAAITALQTAVPTTDVDYAVNIDFSSLGLTDTTYAAASGDGRWITFGEGNKAPVARNFILQDDGTVPNKFTYASPSLNIADLMTNASDNVYGVALDKTGKTIGIHGTETAFSAVTRPFTQRLQGKKSTFAQGAGITFHPNADGTTTAADSRLAFVASANGTLEAVDIAYYDFTRGALATKFNLYGPIRATLPFPGDPPDVVFKLFGLSAKGLLIVNVTAADILPGP